MQKKKELNYFHEKKTYKLIKLVKVILWQIRLISFMYKKKTTYIGTHAPSQRHNVHIIYELTSNDRQLLLLYKLIAGRKYCILGQLQFYKIKVILEVLTLLICFIIFLLLTRQAMIVNNQQLRPLVSQSYFMTRILYYLTPPELLDPSYCLVIGSNKGAGLSIGRVSSHWVMFRRASNHKILLCHIRKILQCYQHCRKKPIQVLHL